MAARNITALVYQTLPSAIECFVIVAEHFIGLPHLTALLHDL